MQEEEKIREAVRRQFGKNAEKYVTSESHAKGSDLALLVEWLEPKPDWIVLDVATGGGHVAKTLAPHVAHVFAADLTAEMLENTARHLSKNCPNVWYVVADAEALPFLPETFDAVTCRIAAHHFPHPERFVREVARVLKPGGRFVLIDNVAPDDRRLAEFLHAFEKMRDESHMKCLSVPEWQALFASAGLAVARSERRKKTHDYPVWAARTADSPEQIERLTRFLLAADDELRRYFAIEAAEQGRIRSLTVDEWMALGEKR